MRQIPNTVAHHDALSQTGFELLWRLFLRGLQKSANIKKAPANKKRLKRCCSLITTGTDQH